MVKFMLRTTKSEYPICRLLKEASKKTGTIRFALNMGCGPIRSANWQFLV